MSFPESQRTPLGDRRPRRIAGQSLDEQIDAIWLDRVVTPVLFVMVMFCFAVMQWVAFWFHTPPSPILMTAIFLAVTAWAARHVVRAKRSIELMKLGRDGERVMAEDLEALRRNGALVFHDIKADRFNLDHVVVAPEGIFVVETKTWNKPKGEHRITMSSEGLVLGKRAPTMEPLIQANAAAAWLREQLKTATGDYYPVRAVLVFHGWYIEPQATAEAKAHGVWLLNPKVLPAWISNGHRIHEDSDLFAVSRFLSQQSQGKL